VSQTEVCPTALKIVFLFSVFFLSVSSVRLSIVVFFSFSVLILDHRFITVGR